MLTLSQIGVLLHYYWNPTEHPDCGPSLEWRACINGLLEAELIRPAVVGVASDGRSYAVTERGAVYVEAIRALPLPVQVWHMPVAAPAASD